MKATEPCVWVVERHEEHGGWHPTVGVDLTKPEGVRALRELRGRFPGERFRLVAYERAARRGKE